MSNQLGKRKNHSVSKNKQTPRICQPGQEWSALCRDGRTLRAIAARFGVPWGEVKGAVDTYRKGRAAALRGPERLRVINLCKASKILVADLANRLELPVQWVATARRSRLAAIDERHLIAEGWAERYAAGDETRAIALSAGVSLAKVRHGVERVCIERAYQCEDIPALVEAFRASGEEAAAFARKHRLPLWWLKHHAGIARWSHYDEVYTMYRQGHSMLHISRHTGITKERLYLRARAMRITREDARELRRENQALRARIAELKIELATMGGTHAA